MTNVYLAIILIVSGAITSLLLYGIIEGLFTGELKAWYDDGLLSFGLFVITTIFFTAVFIDTLLRMKG